MDMGVCLRVLLIEKICQTKTAAVIGCILSSSLQESPGVSEPSYTS